MKAGLIATTQHDKGSAEGTRRLENQGHRAAQLALQGQPMSHLPRDCVHKMILSAGLKLGGHRCKRRQASLGAITPGITSGY